jgi:hypothetical protein
LTVQLDYGTPQPKARKFGWVVSGLLVGGGFFALIWVGVILIFTLMVAREYPPVPLNQFLNDMRSGYAMTVTTRGPVVWGECTIPASGSSRSFTYEFQTEFPDQRNALAYISAHRPPNVVVDNGIVMKLRVRLAEGNGPFYIAMAVDAILASAVGTWYAARRRRRFSMGRAASRLGG